MGEMKKAARSSGQTGDQLSAKQQGSSPTMRILVIDDDELVLGSLEALLNKHKYETVIVQNAFDALEKLDRETFHFVICDVRLPGIDGLKTIEALRNSEGDHINKHIPVVFITGFPDRKVEIESKSLKPVAHLHKPFEDTELLGILRAQLAA